jgi:hypothetical protein
MSEDVEQRPAKRQRFFTDNPSSPLPTKPRDTDASLPHFPEHGEYQTDHGATLEIPSPNSIPKSSASFEIETSQQHTRVRTTESLELPIADAMANCLSTREWSRSTNRGGSDYQYYSKHTRRWL